MRNVNIKPFLYIFAALSVVTLLVAGWIRDVDVNAFWEAVGLVPIVATVDLVAYFVFVKWVWRWKKLQGWLVPYPDLNGTWKGHLRTSWRDENGNDPGLIPVLLTVSQSFARISCVMRTGEMVSRSYAEGFQIDPAEQLRKLCYSYTSTPRNELRDRSTPHDGTILLEISGVPATKLRGEYWTQRETTGSAVLELYAKQRLDELPAGFPRHPMVGQEARTEPENTAPSADDVGQDH